MARKLLLLNPWGVDYMDTPLLDLVSRHVRGDTELVVRNLGESVPPLPWPVATSADRAVEVAKGAEGEGFDGIVIACCADPFLDAVRSSVSIPVSAPTEAVVKSSGSFGRLAIIARQLPDEYTALIPSQGNWDFWRGKAREYGLADGDYTLARVPIPDHPSPAMLDRLTREDPEGLRDLTVTAMTTALEIDGRQAAEQARADGADVIHFACAFWGQGLESWSKDSTGVPDIPVLNPVVCATTFLEQALVSSGR